MITFVEWAKDSVEVDASLDDEEPEFKFIR